MTERLIKIAVMFVAIACALCFSELLIAATLTGESGGISQCSFALQDSVFN